MQKFLRRLGTAHGLHSLFGFSFSVFLFFVFLSGTLLVFGPELDWLRYSQSRVEASSGHKLSWGKIYASAKAARPNLAIVAIERASSPRFADKVVAVNPDRPGDHFLWINPHTAAFRGETSTKSITSVLLQFHERLFISGHKGTFLTTSAIFPVAGAVLAGLFLYRRFWRGYWRWPRFSGRRRAWLGDLHRLMAVWLLPFLAVLIVTCLWYFFENLGLNAPPPPQYKTEQREELLPLEFDGSRLDKLVTRAEVALPGLHVTTIMFPRRPTQPIVVQGDLTALLVRVRANAVAVDPSTLEVIGTLRGEDMSFHQRISEAADPLHFGTWGGLATRIFWLVFGLGATGLALTGTLVHGSSLANQKAKRPERLTKPVVFYLFRDMGPFGIGALISLVLIAIGLGRMLLNFFS